MKKTIAALAILTVGSMSSALVRPPPPGGKLPPKPVLTTVCLKISAVASDRSQTLGFCDQSNNNKRAQADLLENGCAEGQAAIKTYNKVAIGSCMAPGIVQL